MTVRANLAALTTAIDAAVARDATPLQSRDVMRWDPIRQLLLDMAETYYDAGTMRGVVLAANIIEGPMIQGQAVDRIRDLLEGLTGNDRMLITALRGRAGVGQLPSDTVYDADIATLFSSAISADTSITLTNVSGGTTTMNLAEGIRDLVAGFIVGGTDIRATHDDAMNTLTLDFTGTGSGSSRTDAQVEELARDAIATFLRGAASGARITFTHDDAANTLTALIVGLATVATSGSYNDLADVPNLYNDGDMRSDFNTAFRTATSGPRVTLTFRPQDNTLTFGLADLPAAPASFALASSPTGRIPETNAGAESVIGGSITGQVITLTRRDGQNPITITIPTTGTSTPPVSTHQRYGAYGADTTFVATDFTGAGGVGSTNNSLTLAGATARVYVAFWSAMALTTINPDGRLAFGGNNLFSRFTASRLTIGGDNGYLYVSSSTFPAGVVNGAWTLS